MNEKDKNEKLERYNTISEKMKNQALLWGSFGNSILCSIVCIVIQNNMIASMFYRGAVGLYTFGFLVLLLSHFQSTKAINAMGNQNKKEAMRQWEMVGAQNGWVFYLICAGSVFSLLGLWFLTA